MSQFNETVTLTKEQQLLLNCLQTYTKSLQYAVAATDGPMSYPRSAPSSQAAPSALLANTTTATATIDQPKASGVVKADEDIDWPIFWDIVNQHDLLPMVIQVIQTGHLQGVPEQYLTRLPLTSKRVAIQNAYLTQVLLSVLQNLATRGMKVIPFKGPILALMVYGNLCQRRFCDLDLLVSQSDFDQVKQCFLDEGYQLNIEADWSVHLIHPDTDINIDLHHQITETYFPFYLDFDQVFGRSLTQHYANHTIQVLSPEDTLILLAIQLAKDAHHQQKFLKKACDLALLIDHVSLNWHEAIAYSESMGGKRMVLLGLYLAQQLLNTKLLDWVNQQIESDRVLVAYGQSVCERLFTEDGFQRGSRGMLLRALFLFEKPLGLNQHYERLFQHILATTAAKFRAKNRRPKRN